MITVQANKSFKSDQFLNLPVSIFSAKDSTVLRRDVNAYPLFSHKLIRVSLTLLATS